MTRKIEGLCVGVGRRGHSSGDLQGAWRAGEGREGLSRVRRAGGASSSPWTELHSSRRTKPRARHPQSACRDVQGSQQESLKAPALCTEVSQKHTKGVPGPPGPTAPSQHPLPDSTGEESPQHKDHQAGPTPLPHLVRRGRSQISLLGIT